MSDITFPNNIIGALAEHVVNLPNVEVVFERGLRRTDPSGSIGIVAVDWVPSSFQIGQWDPAVAVYLFQIQAFIKHTDEEEGRAAHAVFAKNLRLMLYRNEALRVRLGSLSETEEGLTERTQRWGVRHQRFASNEVEGEFLYLSTTEWWCETETV